MKVIPIRQETLRSGATVYSHESLSDPGMVVVQVLDQGIEIAEIAPTRGEAVGALAAYLETLGRELRKMAWEQEGAVAVSRGVSGAER